jgi:hypothetical protein
VHQNGKFDANGTSYVMDVTQEATFTGSGQIRLAGDAPNHFCALTRGEAQIQTCDHGTCQTASLGIYALADLQSVTVATLDDTPVARTTPPTSADTVMCPHVRVSVSFADGSSDDVTQSVLLQWTIQGTSQTYWGADRARDGSGELMNDSVGNPCVLVPSPAMLPPISGTTNASAAFFGKAGFYKVAYGPWS